MLDSLDLGSSERDAGLITAELSLQLHWRTWVQADLLKEAPQLKYGCPVAPGSTSDFWK